MLLLAISVPADMFGFPYLGVLGKINEVNMTTIYSAIIYIIVVLVLIKIGIRYGDKKYIQAKAIVLAIHKSNTILVALPIFFITVSYTDFY